MQLEYTNLDNKYITIRQVLKQEFGIAGRLIARLKQEKAILLNNEPMYIDKQLRLNDRIIVKIDFKEATSNKVIPVEICLDILYEDEAVLIVNKPPFMPVHPSSSHLTDTLSNGVQYYINVHNINHKVRLVNRLDKNTSGIVIFAKNAYIQEQLIEQMRTNKFLKEYIGLVEGNWNDEIKTINAPIARKENSIIERKIDSSGDISITRASKIKQYDNYALMKFILETGRTHQIRVHCMHVGNPILGDTLYGHVSELISRQALHAYKVTFLHPISKKSVTIEADIPEDIKRLI